MTLLHRKKYQGRYPSQPPTAIFKGCYGALKAIDTEKEKERERDEASARALQEKELLDEKAPLL